MYQQSERPFTDAESQILERRLLECGERINDIAWSVGMLGLIDGIAAVSFVMAFLFGTNEGPIEGLLVGVMLLVANYFLFRYSQGLIDDRRERRMLREAKEYGGALIERITAHAAAYLRSKPGTSWYFIDVGAGWLYVLSEWNLDTAGETQLWPEPIRPDVFPASIEVTRTQRHLIFLSVHADGSAMVPRGTHKWHDMVPDAKMRTAIDSRLQKSSLIAGRLDTLADDVIALLKQPKGNIKNPMDDPPSQVQRHSI